MVFTFFFNQYMTAWGDWADLKPKAFPGGGLHDVSRDISKTGMRPGLWLAPFCADKHSKVSKKHPDWVIRNNTGEVANSSHCGKFFHGLDATNPEVRDHVHEAVRRAVVDWGYNVLKIDFLYAACLEGNGKFDPSMSRAQAMHLALQTIRDAAGADVFLIGCGCPIASGIGFVDAMRVSADTGPTW
jgi:alpha-galactosidase